MKKFTAALLSMFAVAGFAGAGLADEKDKPAEPTKDAAKGETPKADKPKTDKKETLANRTIAGRATRVAVLPFGPPPEWKGLVGSTVGITISAKAFKDVIPMLEADKVDVVVVHINSGGGLLAEMEPFQKLFQRDYESRFRTVAWVHSAISCAAMSPWTLDEFYMEPEGNIGACTGWSGSLVAVKGVQLLRVLDQMEEASRMGGRDPKIMRSMQIMEPLSYNVDEFGNVEYFQDMTSGKYVLNPEGQILTLNAVDAVRSRFARGVASNVPELMKAMNINEYEVVGQKATKYLEDFMRRAHRIEKEVGEVALQYRLSLGAAQGLRGENNRELRNIEIGKCRAALNKIRQQIKVNPNFSFMLAGGFGVGELNDEWFDENERLLKRLVQDR